MRAYIISDVDLCDVLSALDITSTRNTGSLLVHEGTHAVLGYCVTAQPASDTRALLLCDGLFRAGSTAHYATCFLEHGASGSDDFSGAFYPPWRR